MTRWHAAVHAYLHLRRSLGFTLEGTERALLAFAEFLEQQRAPAITTALALTWAQQPTTVQPAAWAQRLTMVRGFARHQQALDPRTEVPPVGLLPYRPRRARPYLYSDAEIRALLDAARRMPGRYERGQLRPWVYFCLFGLLSVTGIRLDEARRLEVADVDLETAVLTIRHAKFGKTRLVPLHPSVCHVLADYLRRRHAHWASRPVSSFLFVSSRGSLLDKGSIERTFHALSRQIGLRGPHDRRGPRLHDFRHRFASTTLWHWYRTGEDPERRLPILSAYLGHVHVRDTYWYLEAWPALMAEARDRLERRWETRP
jgi:integrase/recombinase XerD